MAPLALAGLDVVKELRGQGARRLIGLVQQELMLEPV